MVISSKVELPAKSRQIGRKHVGDHSTFPDQCHPDHSGQDAIWSTRRQTSATSRRKLSLASTGMMTYNSLVPICTRWARSSSMLLACLVILLTLWATLVLLVAMPLAFLRLSVIRANYNREARRIRRMLKSLPAIRW